MGNDRSGSRGKGERAYTSAAVQTAAHPTRQRILKRLAAGDATAGELEAVTGENRYNLYHHLARLEDAGLIEADCRDSRTKRFRLIAAPRPETAVILAARDDEPEQLRRLVQALEQVLGRPIPHRERIREATVMIGYDWADEDAVT